MVLLKYSKRCLLESSGLVEKKETYNTLGNFLKLFKYEAVAMNFTMSIYSRNMIL